LEQVLRTGQKTPSPDRTFDDSCREDRERRGIDTSTEREEIPAIGSEVSAQLVDEQRAEALGVLSHACCCRP
jgi:hypothetical protein